MGLKASDARNWSNSLAGIFMTLPTLSLDARFLADMVSSPWTTSALLLDNVIFLRKALRCPGRTLVRVMTLFFLNLDSFILLPVRWWRPRGPASKGADVEKAWVVGGSSDMVWLVGTRLLVPKGAAEPIEGRSRHFQQLEEAMMTVLSFGLVDCVPGSVVFHGPAALSKSWVTLRAQTQLA